MMRRRQGSRVNRHLIGPAEQWMEKAMLKPLLTTFTAAAVISGLVFTNQASAYNRNVDIVNQSDQTIMEFHASNVGENRWGPDLLGPVSLASGDDVDLNLNDGTGYCRFDFLTVMDDGTALIRPDVNVCRVATYTIE
jgi:hypothetical protein